MVLGHTTSLNFFTHTSLTSFYLHLVLARLMSPSFDRLQWMADLSVLWKLWSSLYRKSHNASSSCFFQKPTTNTFSFIVMLLLDLTVYLFFPAVVQWCCTLGCPFLFYYCLRFVRSELFCKAILGLRKALYKQKVLLLLLFSSH